MNKQQHHFDRLDYTFKLLIVVALIITATILARDIVIPILISGIFSIVMLPVIKRLERKMSSVLAITLTLIFSFLVFSALTWLTISQMSALVKDLPNLESKFNALVDRVSSAIQDTFNMSAKEQNQMLKNSLASLGSYATNLFTATTNIISLLIQVPIYVFLFLIYRDKFRAFVLAFLGGEEDITWKGEVEGVIQGYISGLLLVTGIIAVLNSIGLLILGIDHAIFFGVLSGVLTIIPYVGIFIGATLPVLMALLTKDSLWYAVGVVIIFSIVQFLEGNFITPRITGSRVSINALAAIVALLIGGKILGIAGMILAIPALGILKIILSHTRYLKPFVILIEDTPIKPGTEPSEEQKPEE
ncbi:MAG: AI-2E family transporter [Cyclobacteriaceae bacterium]|nr:AI-2E family transporter [Cyclobacteriaceae bacterium]